MATVGEIIRRYHVEIVTDWTSRARTAASARGLSGPTLTNFMPVFLASLADGADAAAAIRRRDLVLSHLAARIRQGFELAEMIVEFTMLERCIVRACARVPAADAPSESDVDDMRDRVHDATKQLTDAFFRHMFEDEQAEKRYMRLLQDIASEALHDDRRPLRERLHDVLGVIVEALNATTAALLLFDVKSDTLVAAASFGSEVFEDYAVSLDVKSFAGQVAASEVATSLRDVATTTLEVPDSLRKSAIHSVLGVRVPPLSQLHGILYIGVSETRDFTTREVHRLELLADRLALHLENARLFADLHDTINSLQIERGMRDRFVAILAHDLRGPLSTAKLAAGMVVDAGNADTRRALASRIERSIERADRMIRDLLDANRIRAGESLPLRLAECDVCGIAGQIADEARSLYGDRFVVACDEVSGIWSADELHRAVWNLVINAVKYGAEKTPITITASVAEGIVRISVHNEGTPIPASDIGSLFDAFHRTAQADAGSQIGWGLGLALVRGCAEAHGGHAEVASDEAGTTFSMLLPLDATGFQRSQGPASRATVH